MKFLLTLLIALSLPSTVMAKGECKEDKHKFCKGVEKENLQACFDQHANELSAGCKAKREAKAAKKESG